MCEFCENRSGLALLMALGHSEDHIRNFRDELRYSGYRSVDVFLEHNPAFMGIGKQCIAGTLMPYENEDRLFPPAAPSPNWYEYLANYMRAGTEAWRQNRLSLVTFNYDRSFEHYFTRVIAQRRRLSVDAAYEEFDRVVSVLHVHGTLGDYPSGLSYGVPISPESVAAAAQRILVVSEVDDTLPTFETAFTMLRAAKSISFLGFGFHDDNVRRLRYFNQPFSEGLAMVNGTVDGFSDAEWRSICSDTLHGHWRGERPGNVYGFLRYHGGLD